jgi:hypothetical protein
MPGFAGADVDERHKPPVRLADRPRQTVQGGGREDEMHVVGHQAADPARHGVEPALPGQKVAVERVVARLRKQRLPPVAALRYMIGNVGDDDAGETRHQAIISGSGILVMHIMSP